MKSRLYGAVVLVLGGLVGGCSADDKEVGEVKTPVPVPLTPVDQAIGASCVLGDEWYPEFSGYGLGEINIASDHAGCASRFCVANHFRGRQSCPYGQAAPEDPNQFDSPPCLLPDGRARVAVAVEPQDVSRPPEDAVYCSCRCAGPGPGPFCQCPSGFECAPLIDFSGDRQELTGSYCIKAGTAFDPNVAPESCDWEMQSCGPA